MSMSFSALLDSATAGAPSASAQQAAQPAPRALTVAEVRERARQAIDSFQETQSLAGVFQAEEADLAALVDGATPPPSPEDKAALADWLTARVEEIVHHFLTPVSETAKAVETPQAVAAQPIAVQSDLLAGFVPETEILLPEIEAPAEHPTPAGEPVAATGVTALLEEMSAAAEQSAAAQQRFAAALSALAARLSGA